MVIYNFRYAQGKASCVGVPYRKSWAFRDNDDDYPRWNPAESHHFDEYGTDEQLVGQRIEELAEVGHLLFAAGDVAVEKVGDGGGHEEKHGYPAGIDVGKMDEHKNGQHGPYAHHGDAVGPAHVAEYLHDV